jgi:hypothetical protein
LVSVVAGLVVAGIVVVGVDAAGGVAVGLAAVGLEAAKASGGSDANTRKSRDVFIGLD